ncbi:hypothetical protein BGZ65_005096 [Modicella reniformis]|uniref:Uncharacterized protein n=1 Tax=Modicella reniformis TaxID=1440133 RepID=A0A9P6SLB6_9FUNG|nr:hypothetical protein BGZ65_005096 [Modicella reniformis]
MALMNFLINQSVSNRGPIVQSIDTNIQQSQDYELVVQDDDYLCSLHHIILADMNPANQDRPTQDGLPETNSDDSSQGNHIVVIIPWRDFVWELDSLDFGDPTCLGAAGPDWTVVAKARLRQWEQTTSTTKAMVDFQAIVRAYEAWDDEEISMLHAAMKDQEGATEDQKKRALEQINNHRMKKRQCARTAKSVSRKMENMKEESRWELKPQFNTQETFDSVVSEIQKAKIELAKIEHRAGLIQQEQEIRDLKDAYLESRKPILQKRIQEEEEAQKLLQVIADKEKQYYANKQ